VYWSNATKGNNGTNPAYGAAFVSGDIIGVALDMNAGTITFYKNGTSQGQAFSGITGTIYPAMDAFSGTWTVTANFGASSFTYTPPSGFLGLDSNLLSYTVPVSGGYIWGGAAPVSINFTVFTPSGGLLWGGSAPVSTLIIQAYNIPAPTGGYLWGGTAPVVYTPVSIYPITPSGGFTWGGSAGISENLIYIPTGGLLWSGSAPVLEKIPYTPTGGLLWSGSAPVQYVSAPVPSGGYLWGGVAPVAVVTSHPPSGGFVWGGAAVVRAYQAFFAPSGGFAWGGSAIAYLVTSSRVVTTENPYADPFPGWAVNFDNFAPSRYMDMPANSMAQLGGKTYVTNAGGVYVVGADDDAGQPIRASVDFPYTDYQDAHEKRMEAAYFGFKCTGSMKLKVFTNRASPQYYLLIPSGASVKGNRVRLGKGLVGRYWGFRLNNVAGADFELESAEFIPHAGQRHGA